jgi:hypothetical protein
MPEQHHLPEEKLPFQRWKLEKFSEAAVSGTTKKGMQQKVYLWK